MLWAIAKATSHGIEDEKINLVGTQVVLKCIQRHDNLPFFGRDLNPTTFHHHDRAELSSVTLISHETTPKWTNKSLNPCPMRTSYIEMNVYSALYFSMAKPWWWVGTHWGIVGMELEHDNMVQDPGS
jgi:hypothetical protein